jgi:hypothetical protein
MISPALCPKYLLFPWRAAMVTKIPSEIRWVNVDVLKPLKEKVLGN